jgi:DNA-binding MarR family transcriptional regulator
MKNSTTPSDHGDAPSAEDGQQVQLQQQQRKASLVALAEEVFSISTAAWQMRQRQKSAGHIDLSETEFLTLNLLVRNGTMTVGQLQRQIGVLPAQMSRIIRSLEGNFDQPMIHGSINPKDKRKVDVTLTEFGRQAHREFRDARLAQSVELLRHVADKDLDDFMRVLRVLRQSMSRPAEPGK